MAGKLGEVIIGTEHTPVSWGFINRRAAWYAWYANPETGDHWVIPHARGLAMATALEREHVDGSTEPWIQDIVVALLQGLQRVNPLVMEFGGFHGHTSIRLAQALEDQGGGRLVVVEYDPDAPERADMVDARLTGLKVPHVDWTVIRADALVAIGHCADESIDFVYLDDTHTHEHVQKELAALLPKMKPGGLITGHDVFGSTNLQQEFRAFGGYALDLPRLGPAGGLGILQIR